MRSQVEPQGNLSCLGYGTISRLRAHRIGEAIAIGVRPVVLASMVGVS
jgi:hypothetical protein